MASSGPDKRVRDSSAAATARRTVSIERAALDQLYEVLLDAPLSDAFERAVAAVSQAQGRVVVSGVGKSGLVGRKIAATLASTGTPAFFIHPSDASHGDLGMITLDDIVLAISWSGESTELGDLIEYCGRFGVRLIAVTSRPASTLACRATICLALPSVEEACPNRLAPTSSALLQSAIGDALAIALVEYRGFSAEDFRIFHPKGRLGAQLRTVGDLMSTGDKLPRVASTASVLEATVEMSRKRFGITAVVDGDGRIDGVFSDGDLRRSLSAGDTHDPVRNHMTSRPIVVPPDMLASEALAIMNDNSILQLVVQHDDTLVGIVHLHDILREGVV